MKFREFLQENYPQLEHVPSGYKRYGDAMVLRYPKNLSPQLGEAILESFPWCNRVFQHQTTTGENRRPELIHMAGQSSSEVIHKENGVKYVIDLAKITFSGGNRGLRERLVGQVRDGESLLDMFAAVGNLSLQPLVYRKINAQLVERDPYTFDYLIKSLKANSIHTAIAHNMDCRDVLLRDWADRIFLGYHEVDYTHFTAAVRAAKQQAILHLHPLIRNGQYDPQLELYHTWLKASGAVSIDVEINPIKSYAPGIEHFEIILVLEKLTAS